jgi:hypothetical protein
LEIHGKAWKKIEGIIKTRTVVQIRTHAQKYFLKMSKAKQHGDTSGQSVKSSSSKVRIMPDTTSYQLNTTCITKAESTFDAACHTSQRRSRRRAVALTPLLAPFIRTNELDATADLQSTLYHFLSPRVGTVLTQTSTLVTPILNDASPKPLPNGASGDVIPTLRTQLTSADLRVPQWYAKRENIDSLLQIAESLDWAADSGVGSISRLPQSSFHVTNATSELDESGRGTGAHGGGSSSLEALYNNPEFIEAMWTQRLHLAMEAQYEDVAGDLNTVSSSV